MRDSLWCETADGAGAILPVAIGFEPGRAYFNAETGALILVCGVAPEARPHAVRRRRWVVVLRRGAVSTLTRGRRRGELDFSPAGTWFVLRP